jgi:hypothetical protein
LLYLTFVPVVAKVQSVVASANAGIKASGCGDVLVVERVTGAESPSAREPPVQVETTHIRDASMLDIVLVSRRNKTVNRDAVCGLLMECLHDVSSTMCCLLSLFVIWLLMFDYFCDRLLSRLRLSRLSSLRIVGHRSKSALRSLKQRILN